MEEVDVDIFYTGSVVREFVDLVLNCVPVEIIHPSGVQIVRPFVGWSCATVLAGLGSIMILSN